MLQTFKNTIGGGYRLIMSLGLLLGIASCNALRDNTIAVRNDDGGGEAVALRVRAGVRDIATKAETQTSAEKQVNTLDLFIFDTDSEALLFKQRVSAASAEVRITKGARTFYALVNAPAAASALSTLSEVAAYHAAFADQGRSSFFMAGSKAVTVTSATTEVVVDVRRDVARVDLVNAPTFSGQAAGATFNAAYLINVPKTYSASATVAAAADAWNFGDAVATASEQDALLKLTAAGSVYGMPNTTAEAAAIDGTDYVTKLVIKATVNGSVYWYPIGIPGIASNKRYVVENVYIKGVGSDEPNQYVDNQVFSATVNVLDWDDASIDGSYHEDLLTKPTKTIKVPVNASVGYGITNVTNNVETALTAAGYSSERIDSIFNHSFEGETVKYTIKAYDDNGDVVTGPALSLYLMQGIRTAQLSNYNSTTSGTFIKYIDLTVDLTPLN